MCTLQSRNQCEAGNYWEEKEYQLIVSVSETNAWLLQAWIIKVFLQV